MAKIKNVTTIRIGYDNFIVPTDKLQTVVAALALLQKVERGYIDHEETLIKQENAKYSMEMRDCEVFADQAAFEAALEAHNAV